MLLAALPLPAAGPPGEPNPYSVVGVCPIPQGSRSWAIVWHFSPDAVDPVASVRVQKFLEGSDFDACLLTLIVTDPETSALAAKIRPEASIEELTTATVGIRRRWTAFGVDRAILEVMKEGKRGERTQSLLEACERLTSQPASAPGRP